MVGRVSIVISNSRVFECLENILIENSDIQHDGVLDIEGITGYYFLCKEYAVYVYKLFKNKRVLKIDLKEVEVRSLNFTF